MRSGPSWAGSKLVGQVREAKEMLLSNSTRQDIHAALYTVRTYTLFARRGRGRRDVGGEGLGRLRRLVAGCVLEAPCWLLRPSVLRMRAAAMASATAAAAAC